MAFVLVFIVVILILRFRPGMGEQEEFQTRPPLPWCEECGTDESVVRVDGERLCYHCAEMREVLL